MRTARILFVSLVSLALGAGCGSHAAPGRAGADPAAPGWISYTGTGVSMNVPDTWGVDQDEDTGRLEIDGPDGEEAIVWPVFLPRSSSIDHPESLARVLTSRAWPDVEWHRPQVRSGRDSVMLRNDDEENDEMTTALLGWTRTPKGTAAVLYAIRSESDLYAAFAATAREAFASYRLTGGKAAPAGQDANAQPARPGLQWTRFVDPRERAFSVDVPQGWATDGGVFRFGAVDVRLAVQTRSPDGNIIVRLGDQRIGTFVTGAIGYGEGQTFSPGYGQMMTVRQYVPPARFAAEEASRQPGCDGFQPIDMQPRPDLTSAMNDLYQRYQLAVRLDAGDVTFTCGSQWHGYWMAALQIVQMGGPAMWKPEYLLGYMARPSYEAEAQAVISHLISSIQVDPGWYQRQTGQAGQVSAVVSQTGQAISTMVSNGYWQRHAGDRGRSIAQENATMGIEQVEDPGTGDRWDVDAGSNYYWVDPQGTIVGTQTDALPQIDFKQLTVVKPGR